MTLIVHSLSSARSGPGLARVARREDVHLTGERRPVDRLEVAELFGVGEPDGLHGAGVTVDVGHPPGDSAGHDGLDGEIQPAVPGAQAEDVHGVTADVRRRAALRSRS